MNIFGYSQSSETEIFDLEILHKTKVAGELRMFEIKHFEPKEKMLKRLF